jgi:ribosomal protein S18 acetylase RimI-like enzyme
MFKVHEIKEEDLPKSAQIIRDSFKTVADEFGITEENTPTHGTFLKDEKLLADYNCGIKMFGLFEWEKQVGFIALETKGNGHFSAEKLSVLPDFRHKRGGRELMQHVEEYVKNEGGKLITISIIYENIQLLEWYKELGYEETGTKVFPNFPFTICFMKKEF